MFYVIEVENGRVRSITRHGTEQGAHETARNLCTLNGIWFQGEISCDGDSKQYNIQIIEVENE